MSSEHNQNENIHSQKEELASLYISVFKKELSDTEQDVLNHAIELKLKYALISQDDDSFDDIMKQFDGVLVESMKTKVTLFLQEKREILWKTNTKESLDELKKNITATPADPSLKESLGVMAWWWVADYIKGKTFEKRRNTKVDTKAIESSIDDIVQWLKHKSQSAELTKPMKKELQQMIKEVKETKNYIGSAETLSKRNKLVEAKVLPVDLLKKIKISPAMKESLELIKTEKLSSELAGKSASEIKDVLASKDIANLSDDVIEMISKGKSVEHIDDIVHIMSESSHLTHFAKVFAKIPILDAAIIWYDIYNYTKSKKTEKDKWHLGITTVANLAGALWPIFCTGPVWWAIVGTAIAVDIGVSHAIDVGYYDIKDELHQSKKDLAEQEVVSLKQILIESLAVKGGLSRSSNEAMYDTICRRRWEDDGKEKTASDIGSILIEQSESQLWNDTDPKKNPRIWKRIEYMKTFLPGWKNNQQLSKALQSAQWMKMIDSIISDSIVYADMKSDTSTQAITIESYKQDQIEKLQNENPRAFAQLESFLQKDPLQASEFIHQVSSCASALTKDYNTSNSDIDDYEKNIQSDWWISDPSVDDASWSVGDNENIPSENYDTASSQSQEELQQEKVKTMIDYVNRYARVRSAITTLPDVPIVDNKYLSTEQMLIDLADGKPLQTYSQGQTEDFVKQALLDRNQSDQIENFTRSSDLRQNIIYRLAKSFHGYTGWNTMKELVEFFADNKEWNDNKKGIYYNLSKQQWMINDDYAKDQPLNFDNIEKKSVDDIIKDWTTITPNRASYMMGVVPWAWLWSLVLQKITGIDVVPKTTKDMIDTKTETPDAQLNEEFITRLKTILTEEKNFLSPEYNQKITTLIMDYLSTNKPENWKYIRLPWYLVLQAQQAGLWNLSEYYFSSQGWKRKALTVNDRMTAGGILPDVEVQYIVDKDGASNKWQLLEEEFAQLSPVKLSPEKLAIKNSLQKILHDIVHTNSSLSWIGRGEVSYDPFTEQLSSYDTTTKISVQDGRYVLDDGALQMKYKTPDEAIHMALLKNRFDGKYKKEHKNPQLYYNEWIWSFREWIMDRNNISGWWNTICLLSDEQIETYFSTSFSEQRRKNKSLSYLQW